MVLPGGSRRDFARAGSFAAFAGDWIVERVGREPFWQPMGNKTKQNKRIDGNN